MNDSSKQVGSLKARRLRLAQVFHCLRAVALLFLVCTTVQAATPMQSAGGDHTLALKADGTVWAWGNNDDGQLGDGTTTQRSTPVKITLPGGVLASAVSAGERFSLALGADGFVYAWGYNGQGQLGKVTTIGHETENWAPVKIASLSGVTAVEAGAYHVAALKDAGQVWTWGANWSNQLGRNGGANDATPGQVSTLPGGTYLAVSAGGAHTVALKNDGTVFSWGANSNGQLGNGSSGTDGTFPALVLDVGGSGTLGDVAKVDAGRNHTLALLNTGGMVAWGANWAGQLGDGTTTEHVFPVTVTTTGINANISKIKAGGAHSMLLTDTGAVWGWGYNTVKQVSTGATQSENLPISINVPGTAVAINAGVSHSGALMSDGTVRSWGHDGKGHRGDGERAYHDGAPRLTLINLQALAAVSLVLPAGSPGSVAASFTLNSTVAGTAYWVLITDDKRPPDYAKIKLAQDGDSGAASQSGSQVLAAAGTTPLSAALVPGTAYRLFVYVEPSGADCSSSTVNCSNVASLDFSASAGIQDRPAGTPTGTTAPIAVTITDTKTTVSGTTGSTVGSTGTATASSTGTTPAGSSGSSSASKVPVIEYFHAGFGHYFITASSGEIALLDDGKFQGWARTGQSFNVHSSPDSSDSAVCRFFSGASFSPKSSHFYTPSAAECEKVRQGGVWQYEAEPFYVQQPVAGICPAGKQGVYRLYNNGMGGAPNHRYLTSVTIREQMVAQGWIVEGVVFCADN